MLEFPSPKSLNRATLWPNPHWQCCHRLTLMIGTSLPGRDPRAQLLLHIPVWKRNSGGLSCPSWSCPWVNLSLASPPVWAPHGGWVDSAWRLEGISEGSICLRQCECFCQPDSWLVFGLCSKLACGWQECLWVLSLSRTRLLFHAGSAGETVRG